MVINLWCAECGKPVAFSWRDGDYEPCCNDCALWTDIRFPDDGNPEHVPFVIGPLFLYVRSTWPHGRPLSLPLPASCRDAML